MDGHAAAAASGQGHDHALSFLDLFADGHDFPPLPHGDFLLDPSAFEAVSHPIQFPGIPAEPGQGDAGPSYMGGAGPGPSSAAAAAAAAGMRFKRPADEGSDEGSDDDDSKPGKRVKGESSKAAKNKATREKARREKINEWWVRHRALGSPIGWPAGLRRRGARSRKR